MQKFTNTHIRIQAKEMTQDERDFFDEHLDRVMASMPRQVHELLNKVPMFVEDYPSQQVMRQMGIRRREQLCGLYTGIPLTDRSVMQSGVLSDVIHIYREGILLMAVDGHGHVDDSYLREQIRITVLHELGHHHGLDEDDLRELGYG